MPSANQTTPGTLIGFVLCLRSPLFPSSSEDERSFVRTLIGLRLKSDDWSEMIDDMSTAVMIPQIHAFLAAFSWTEIRTKWDFLSITDSNRKKLSLMHTDWINFQFRSSDVIFYVTVPDYGCRWFLTSNKSAMELTQSEIAGSTLWLWASTEISIFHRPH